MTQAPKRARLPRVAAWLVEMFAPADRAESILGDLQEEFLDIASQLGLIPARRWYWRQSVKTTAHLAGAAFRMAPWSLAGVVLLGFLLRWFDLQLQLPQRIMVGILRAQRPYSNLHYGFYLWQINYVTKIACVVTSMLIGCIVAILAKGREVVAAFTLIVANALPFMWLMIFVYKYSLDGEPSLAAAQFHFLVFRWTLDVIGVLVAGVLVRKLRSASSHPLNTI